MSSTLEAKGAGLSKGRLGVAGIVFFVVAASAPMAGMTGVVPVAAVLGNGAAVPGAYVFVGIILLLFSVGFTAMSHKVTNAGAFFAYVGKGLGLNMGVAASFVSVLAYMAVQFCIYGFFAAMMSFTFAGMGVDLPWFVWFVVGWVFVTLLSLFSVDVGAKFLGVLTSLEVLSMLITGIAILANGGPEGWNFEASFAPTNVFAGGFAGTAGIALAFAFASFIGFESTAIYGEEAKDPKKTVRRATYWAVGIIAGLFAIVSFAMMTGMGSSSVIDQILERSDGLADPAAVLFSLAAEYVGPWMATLMQVLIITSLFAGLLAFQNAGARYFFAMSRGGTLPAKLATTNRRGAPSGGVWTMSIAGFIVVGLFAVFALDPILNLFYWLSAVAVLAITLVEILVSIAVIAYFAKNEGANVWQGKIAPALAAIGMALAMYLIVARFNLLAGTAAEGVDPTLPESAFALSPLGWFLVTLPAIFFVIGLIVGVVNKKENATLTQDMMS
ncbi:APC family permease [Aurantimicrobium minutum]|jgi:amino acid transporter|uniref:APC family permease n=1 Tax=Aurantimicrobium minutum TaxID=708131 RepID=UPI000BBAF6D3|nr:APC family permease [Aurantimicrobium minutum]MDH6238820.1 amino acid transporter [Aurantimicrobium minutum]